MQKIFDLIEKETTRQKQGLELIPSENYVSKDVLKALGSILTDKYAEGYPGRRYYGGNGFIDEVEREAQSLANQIFGTVHANVQSYSGSPANLAVWNSVEPTGNCCQKFHQKMKCSISRIPRGNSLVFIFYTATAHLDSSKKENK